MRTALLACSAVICCCAVLAWQPGAAHAKSAGLDGTERKVVKLVNRIRARHGLRRLKASRTLARAASDHTGDMLRADFLEPRLERRHADGHARAPLHRRALGRREHRRHVAPARRRAPRRAHVDGLAAPPRGAAVAERAAASASAASAAGWAARGGRCSPPISPRVTLSRRRRRRLAFAVGNELDRPRLPGADARPADRVAADAERDLADRLRALRGRGRARLAGLLLPRRRRVHRRLGLRHARRPLLADVGQGHAVRRLPGLDARPHRGGRRADRRRLPVLRPRRQPRGRAPSSSPCSPR